MGYLIKWPVSVCVCVYRHIHTNIMYINIYTLCKQILMLGKINRDLHVFTTDKSYNMQIA